MLSIPDMAVLGAAALLFFGPDQLPKVARKAGGFMREVQNTSQSFIREMERAADMADVPPAAPPPVWEPPAPVAEVLAEPRSAGEAYVDPYAAQPHSAFDPAPPQSAVPGKPVIPDPSLPDRAAAAVEPAQAPPQGDHPTHV